MFANVNLLIIKISPCRQMAILPRIMSSLERSARQNIKSLRDCLLRSTVVKFDKIFLDYDQKSKKDVVKEEICLPTKLFENIQRKSLEIFWVIPHKSLTTCLAYRESLNWTSIDLRMGPLEEEHLLNMAKSNFPINRLSFQTFQATDRMLDVIDKFSSVIEVLEISYPLNSYYNEHHRPAQHKLIQEDKTGNLINFQKLKTLYIDFAAVPDHLLRRINLSSCSDSLRQLVLYEKNRYSYGSGKEILNVTAFIDSMKVLTNLETLMIHAPVNSDYFEESISHLKNLRTLFMLGERSYDARKPKFVEVLSKLENLILHPNNLIAEFIFLNGKMLNYAGTGSKDIPPRITKSFSKKFGSHSDLSSFLNYLDFTYDLFYHMHGLHDMELLTSYLEEQGNDTSSSLTASQLKKVEKAILENLVWNRSFGELYSDVIVNHEQLWTKDFLMKLANVCSSKLIKDIQIMLSNHLFRNLVKFSRLKTFISDYNALNPNSSVSNSYDYTLWKMQHSIDSDTRSFLLNDKLVPPIIRPPRDYLAKYRKKINKEIKK